MRIHQNELVYRTQNPVFFYIPAILFLLGAIVTFFMPVHFFVPAVLSLFFLLCLFRQRHTILVHEKKFILREDFLPWNLMSVNRSFDYDRISYFEYNGINQKYSVSDYIYVLFFGLIFLFIKNSRDRGFSHARLDLEFVNTKQLKCQEVIIIPLMPDFIKAFEMIEERVTNEYATAE